MGCFVINLENLSKLRPETPEILKNLDFRFFCWGGSTGVVSWSKANLSILNASINKHNSVEFDTDHYISTIEIYDKAGKIRKRNLNARSIILQPCKEFRSWFGGTFYYGCIYNVNSWSLNTPYQIFPHACNGISKQLLPTSCVLFTRFLSLWHDSSWIQHFPIWRWPRFRD